VIGDINHFDECSALASWCGRNALFRFVEGVLDRSGVFQALDAEGKETQTQLLPRHAIQQRRKDQAPKM